MQVSPSAYRSHAARQRNLELRSARAKRDELLMPHIERFWHANMQVYGAEMVLEADEPQGHCGSALYRGTAHTSSGSGGRTPRQDGPHHHTGHIGTLPAGPGQ